jgi:hypothetical protein
MAVPSRPAGHWKLVPSIPVVGFPCVSKSALIVTHTSKNNKFTVDDDHLMVVAAWPRGHREIFPSFATVLRYPHVSQEYTISAQASEKYKFSMPLHKLMA